MRVLCAIDSLGPGGAQRQFVTIASALSRRGHAVSVLTYHPDSFFLAPLQASGIGHISVQKKGRWSLSPLFSLRRLLRSGKFDAVLAFQKSPSIYAELACLGVGNVRLVVSERNYSHNKTMLGTEGGRMVLHTRADVVTCNSHSQAAWITSHCPWLRGRVRTIWNGVSPEWFESMERPQRDSGRLRLLVVGRIARQKNPMGLARAVALCRDSLGIHAAVSWVGATDVDAGPYAQELRAFLKEHRLDGQWQFLGVQKGIRALMQAHDALILPSLFEGLPNVVCEAMAAGLPVLASDVCDHSRLVADGGRGFLFDPNSPESMAEAIKRFSLLDDESLRQMSANAREFARNSLSVETCVDAYERALSGA